MDQSKSRRATPLPGSPEPPISLLIRYAAWEWEVAYQYDVPALTYRLEGPSGEIHFLKLAPTTHYPTPAEEARRTRWARGHLPVPDIVDAGVEGAVAWLVTVGLPGVDATVAQANSDAEGLVATLAAGLRRFHEAPVQECPFDFRLTAALAHVRQRLNEGHIVPDRDFHSEFAHLSANEAVRILESSRPRSEDLVVCHGDYCLPNILITDGEATGFIDLGELGVADRWWDLAVATWSLSWNLGPGYEELFLREYGVALDLKKRDYYRLLYDLVS